MSIYDPLTYKPREAAPGLMGRVRVALLDALDAELEPFGLKASDYIVLVTLANDSQLTASSGCSVVAHDPGAMTRKIDGGSSGIRAAAPPRPQPSDAKPARTVREPHAEGASWIEGISWRW